MLYRKLWICVAVLLLAASGTMTVTALTPQEQLGKKAFFDTDLSSPPGQSCAACHGPDVGFTGHESDINAHGSVYEGAVTDRFGNRKPPSAAYAGDSPILALIKGTWTGGMFWDGRATGLTLGDPLAEQALGPFLNPLEQNNPDKSTVVNTVKNYGDLLTDVCGLGLTDDEYYVCIGRSIAAYERSSEVTKFTSRYDLRKLTPLESKGQGLFNGKGKCNKCHTSSGKKAVFTDFTYDNLGVPKNPENPFYNMPPEYNPDGADWIDLGLGGFLGDIKENGKHKVPTLRNVAKGSCEAGYNPCITKAYSHNGYFKSLKQIVHFYNTRDVPGAVWDGQPWPAPEVPDNINKKELGNLGLTNDEENAIVAFLNTLDDQ